MAFHEVRFPIDIARGSRGGPERRTEIVELGSGREERNSRWAHSRRRFNAGYGVRHVNELAAIVRFFEERRGRLHGFRYRDPLDFQSGAIGVLPSMMDQIIGYGDGTKASFPLTKAYGSGASAYVRPITKPVSGSILVAKGGVASPIGSQCTVNVETGMVTFLPGHVPLTGAVVTAGYAFDVPVRFDTDSLDIDLSAFGAGDIPNIPIIEIIP
jgi:uncharacterized protein (TIGR02217 family)